MHAFRHGSASALFEAGVDLGTVARFLRHRDMSTVNRYVHSSSSRVRQEIETKLGRYDADALGTLSGAHTEAMTERIADRVAKKLLQYQAVREAMNEEGAR